MKPLCRIFVCITIVSVVIILSNPVFAKGGGYHAPKLSHELKIKVLKDSVLALQQTNPDLANRLNDYANEETEGLQKKNKEDSKIKAKLLKDAETALKQSNPDLAKVLKKMKEEEREGPGLLEELLGMK